MTIFEMSAAIAACHAAMVQEGIGQEKRDRVLERFGKSMAKVALVPPRSLDDLPRVPEVRHG